MQGGTFGKVVWQAKKTEKPLAMLRVSGFWIQSWSD